MGLNGQEKDVELAAGMYTAEYWEYDARIGRRWNMDPVVYPWQSPYACFNNNPVYYSDPSGLEGDPANPKKDGKGDNGTVAPNGGKRNGDGSITGGDAFCPGCGKNGEDIYGIPSEGGDSYQLPKKPNSTNVRDNTNYVGIYNNNPRHGTYNFDQALNQSKYPNWLWKLLYFGQGGFNLTSADDRYIMASARDRESDRKNGRPGYGLPSWDIDYDKLIIPDKSSPAALAGLKFRLQFTKYGLIGKLPSQDVFELTQTVTGMFDKQLNALWSVKETVDDLKKSQKPKITKSDSVIHAIEFNGKTVSYFKAANDSECWIGIGRPLTIEEGKKQKK